MAAEPKVDTAKTVCVACKLSHGHELQLWKLGPVVRGEQQGAKPIGKPVVLAGSNAADTIGGYGFTYNVDAAFFREWMAQNQEFPAVIEGLIFAREKPADARDKAREMSGILTGFEGLDPEQPREGVLVDTYEGRPKTLPVPGMPQAAAAPKT